jgi:hypothetical protein
MVLLPVIIGLSLAGKTGRGDDLQSLTALQPFDNLIVNTMNDSGQVRAATIGLFDQKIDLASSHARATTNGLWRSR